MSSKLLLLIILIDLACQGKIAAQIITPLNSTSAIVSNSLPDLSNGPANDGGTTGTDGYYLFDTQLGSTVADISNLPSYVSNVNVGPSMLEYATGNTTITASTISYASGVVYNNAANNTGTAPLNLADIQLTGAVPAKLNVGVLNDYPDFGGSGIYTLSLYSTDPFGGTNPAPISSAALNNTPLSNPSTGTQNYYFYGEVMGAISGDYLLISATPPNPNAQVTLGGLTFDNVASVPEPSTWAMLLGGLGLLAYIQRCARRA